MEDIISIFDAATEEFLENTIGHLDSTISKYLKKELSTLVKNANFTDSIAGSVFDRQNSQERADEVLKRINRICSQLNA